MALLALAACGPAVIDPERAAQLCEARAQAAQGPTGEVTVGVNSESGGFGGLSVGLSSDFLVGRDPLAVRIDFHDPNAERPLDRLGQAARLRQVACFTVTDNVDRWSSHRMTAYLSGQASSASSAL